MGAPQPVNDYDVRSDRTPVVADRVHLQLLTALDVNTPRFVAARFPGIDAVGHRFLRYADPSAFGDVSAEETPAVWPRAATVLRLSRHAGRPARSSASGRTICCSSCRASAWSRCRPASACSSSSPATRRLAAPTNRRRMVSFLRLALQSRRAGQPRASLVDLAPTILYFLGLPVGRDMDGFARIDLFKPAFTSDKPVTYIPSYGR